MQDHSGRPHTSATAMPRAGSGGSSLAVSTAGGPGPDRLNLLAIHLHRDLSPHSLTRLSWLDGATGQ